MDTEKFSLNTDDADYIQLVKTFAPESRKHADELLSLLAARNWPGYIVRVHGMKSALRMVGASELGEFAYRLELAAKGGDFETCAKETDEFTRRVFSLSDEMKTAIGNLAPQKTGGEATDEATVKNLLRELLQACRDFNLTSADEIASEIAKKTVNANFDAKVANIIEKVEIVEYEEAADEIEKLLS